MTFHSIETTDHVSEGEYVYHTPTKMVVLCGGFSRPHDKITALLNGRLLEDCISNFKKIRMPRKEESRQNVHTRCGGCKKLA
jgi:hypothetical protein